MDNFFSSLFKLVGYSFMSLLPLGWMYWLWVAIKVGGFAMFILAFFPITTPIASILGAWCFIFGIPEWIQNVFIY